MEGYLLKRRYSQGAVVTDCFVASANDDGNVDLSPSLLELCSACIGRHTDHFNVGHTPGAYQLATSILHHLIGPSRWVGDRAYEAEFVRDFLRPLSQDIDVKQQLETGAPEVVEKMLSLESILAWCEVRGLRYLLADHGADAPVTEPAGGAPAPGDDQPEENPTSSPAEP